MLKQNPLPIAELRSKGQLLSDKDWLLRIILLESIAGVPGMVSTDPSCSESTGHHPNARKGRRYITAFEVTQTAGE